MYFVLSRAVTRGTVACTLDRTDAGLDLRAASRFGDCSLVTTARTPYSQLLNEQMSMSQVNVAAEVFQKSFDNKSGALPGATCTRSTWLTLAIPTGKMARVLVSVGHRYHNGRSWPSRAGSSACADSFFV